MHDSDLEELVNRLADVLEARAEFNKTRHCVYPSGMRDLPKEEYETKLFLFKQHVKRTFR